MAWWSSVAELALVFALLLREPTPAVLTHYGQGDGFLGQHHGAYWHGDSCGLPGVVDLAHYGVAAPRWIPYCTKFLVCHEQACIVATAVDRQKHDIIDSKPHFDLWPAAAQALGIVELGIARGRTWTP